MDLRILEDLGLSNAEVKIYLALLELGESKTGKVIDKTKLQSSTVYHLLGSLLEKGLISYILKGKVKYYHALNPDSLLTFLEDKRQKLQEILPLLKEKERLSTQKQTAKVYEGVKGLQAAFSDVLNTMKKGEEYFFFQFPREKFDRPHVVRFFRNYHLKRSAKGIKVRGLATRGARRGMQNVYDLPHTKIRYTKELLPTVLVVYEDKTITIEWEDRPVAFVMQSESVANSYKKFFEEKWKSAKE